MISIVTAYFNRKGLFINTLNSIAKSECKDFEVIAVDDASREEERLEDLDYPFLKVIRVEPEDKWYMNSCIPYNLGIAQAKGDIIILQNPECLHVYDILTYIDNNICSDNYISISTYALNKSFTELLPMIMNGEAFTNFFKNLPQQRVSNYIGWYNHSRYNPSNFHFCSAITKGNMDKLGGFDTRYAKGIAYEDNEFFDRVKRLKLKTTISDDVSVIHQWHPRVYDLEISPYYLSLYQKNARLHRITKREKIIKV